MASEQQKMTSVHHLQELPDLPQEIILDILLRLPVKSLLRFRKFIVCENSCIVNVVELDRFQKIPSLSILGSCNGLLCLFTSSYKLSIWNPSTRQTSVIDDPCYEIKDGGYVTYGFGYDESHDDYKLVKIFGSSVIDDPDGTFENAVTVYSRNAKSWREIPGFYSEDIYGQTGIFLNGVVHWGGSNFTGPPSSEIYAFDLAAETHRTIALPGVGSYEDQRSFWRLGVLGGNILVACCQCSPETLHIWALKSYGVEESWTKLVSFSLDYEISITPVFVTQNVDEVLLQFDLDKLLLFRLRDDSSLLIQMFPSNNHLLVQMATYIESLVSFG